MTEEWKPIPGYEGLYEISNLGRVRGLASNSVGLLASSFIERNRYCFVNLSKENKQRTLRVHRLVLLAFVGPPEPGQVCMHLDNNPRNNALSNLRWGSQKENLAMISPEIRCSKTGKITWEEAGEIRWLHRIGAATETLATAYNLHVISIKRLLSDKTWVGA